MSVDGSPDAGGAPLSGVTVIEVGNYIAGPFCAMQLADLGADVIKIEEPSGGDIVRAAGPFVNGQGAAFVRINRNKRSLALDLKAERGREVFRRLAARSDIIVENLRPGAMARLGLDYASLSPLNRGLIYLAASGWGQDGPLAQLPGLDIMVQARSGLMSITGEPDGDPVKVGVPICDLVGALYGALAILAALAVRERTGEGQLVDVSLLESTMSLAVWEAGRYFTTGEIPRRLGSAHQTSAPYQAIRARDGWFTVGATSPRNWHAFCRALALDRLADDARYRDVNLRFANRTALIDEIERTTTAQPASHWIERLEREGVPCAPIQDFGQSFNEPQLVSRGFFWDAVDPTMGEVRELGSPMRFSATRLRRRNAGPLLGQDTRAVLAELGCSPGEVDDLVESGVAGVPREAAGT